MRGRFEWPRIRRERVQIGQVGLVKRAFLFFRSYNLNFHAQLFGKQWCINTLSLRLRNIRKFLNSRVWKNRSFSVWTPLLTAIFWTFSPAFIFSSAVKERWGLSRTESVLIFKIGKREPLFFSIWKLLVVAEFENGALWASGYCFKSTTE